MLHSLQLSLKNSTHSSITVSGSTKLEEKPVHLKQIKLRPQDKVLVLNQGKSVPPKVEGEKDQEEKPLPVFQIWN